VGVEHDAVNPSKNVRTAMYRSVRNRLRSQAPATPEGF
jgi:hypothetical protein